MEPLIIDQWYETRAKNGPDPLDRYDMIYRGRTYDGRYIIEQLTGIRPDYMSHIAPYSPADINAFTWTPVDPKGNH